MPHVPHGRSEADDTMTSRSFDLRAAPAVNGVPNEAHNVNKCPRYI